MQALQLPFESVGRLVRLACLRHAASVHPEPGSNSQKKINFFSVCFNFLAFSNYLTFCSVFRDLSTLFRVDSTNISNPHSKVNIFFNFFLVFLIYCHFLAFFSKDLLYTINYLHLSQYIFTIFLVILTKNIHIIQCSKKTLKLFKKSVD